MPFTFCLSAVWLIRLDHLRAWMPSQIYCHSMIQFPSSSSSWSFWCFFLSVIDSCHGHLLFALLISIFFVDWHLFTFDWVLEVFHLVGPPLYSTYSNVFSFVYLLGIRRRETEPHTICQHCVALGFNWVRGQQNGRGGSWVDFMCGPISKYNIFCLYYSKCLHFVIGTSKCQVTLQKGSPICLPSILENNHLCI